MYQKKKILNYDTASSVNSENLNCRESEDNLLAATVDDTDEDTVDTGSGSIDFNAAEVIPTDIHFLTITDDIVNAGECTNGGIESDIAFNCAHL